MTWDQLLDRLEDHGEAPEELDFMDNYGPIARSRHPILEGRRPRCIFGRARVRRRVTFDVYLFPSVEEAREFRDLVGRSPGWFTTQNMVVRTNPTDLAELEALLGEISERSTPKPRSA